jgi:hypothetical protein
LPVYRLVEGQERLAEKSRQDGVGVRLFLRKASSKYQNVLESVKRSQIFLAFQKFLLRHPVAFAIWYLLLTSFGQVVLFWRKPQLTEIVIKKCIECLEPGDTIGVFSRRYATGLVLPKGILGVEHSAVYLGDGSVAEALTPCVRIIGVHEFLRNYDKAIVGKLSYGADRKSVANYARSRQGTIYDVVFGSGPDMLYCHELTALSLISGGLAPVRSNTFWLFDDFLDCYSAILTFSP